jgi:hypothetical protein
MARVPFPMVQLHRASAYTARAVGLAVLLASCTEAVRVGQNFASGDADSSGGDGFGGFGGSVEAGAPPIEPPDASTAVCNDAACGNMGVLECGNCDDDDGDGVVDAADPECLGPCDNDEAELMSGMTPGGVASCNADCYFDLNAGRGDDGCRWRLDCDPLSVEANDYAPTGRAMCAFSETTNCSLSDNQQSACQDSCRPLTPNGCDCFGCCEIPFASGHFVWLGSDSLAAGDCNPNLLDGPLSCAPCTPVDVCSNPCGECELCVGKTAEDLPPICGTGGGVVLPACEGGQQPCDPARGFNCSSRLEYCITGCCAPVPQ